MAFLDWIKRPAKTLQKSDDRGAGWERLKIYLYRADGRYGPAAHAETPEAFGALVPKIREHVDNKLEVRITDSGDQMLFHATAKGIVWDGIGLTPILDHNHSQSVPVAEKALFAEWRQDHEMAGERDTTGKEPEGRPIPAPETGKSKTAPTPAKRVKVRSRDIPF